MQQRRKCHLSVMLISMILLLMGIGTAWGWGEATYTASTGNMYLPVLDVPDSGMFEVTLLATDNSGHEFVLKSVKPVASGSAVASYDAATGIVVIPYLVWEGRSNTTDYVFVEMKLIPDSDPLRFRIIAVMGQNLGVGATGPQGPKGDTGATGPIGPQGATGSNGLNSLIELTDLSVEDQNCPYGGVMIQVGLDSDRDGQLDVPGEVIQTSYVCNGGYIIN